MNWEERFEAFERSKSQAALDAAIAPFRTGIDNAGETLEWIESRWSRGLFDGPFYLSPAKQDLPAVGLVFVQSHDGNTVADDPGRLGGGETDKHLIYEGLSRVAADAVLAGADTIRGGDVLFSVWHPEMIALRASLGLPRHPAQIVTTLRGLDFAHAMLLNVPSIPVVILTVSDVAKQIAPAVAERPWIRVITLRQREDLRPAFVELREIGVRRVSVVGGRTIASAIIDAGLAQDLYLTTSPLTGGLPDTPLYPRALPRELIVRKHGTGADTGVVFEHWRLRHGP